MTYIDRLLADESMQRCIRVLSGEPGSTLDDLVTCYCDTEENTVSHLSTPHSADPWTAEAEEEYRAYAAATGVDYEPPTPMPIGTEEQEYREYAAATGVPYEPRP